jgi:hypothetical protein
VPWTQFADNCVIGKKWKGSGSYQRIMKKYGKIRRNREYRSKNSRLGMEKLLKVDQFPEST